MDAAGSAVGIASLGIQICQGLLSYYDGWRGYDADVSSAYDTVDDLSRTLALLRALLGCNELDEEKKDRVKRCLHSCEERLAKLSRKSQKLRKYGQPEGFRQKAWAELQRAWYPFRASTLARLREIVADVLERLKLAIDVLQLDVSTTSQRTLKSVAANTSNLVSCTVAIATSVAHVSAHSQQILDLQQSDQFKKIKAWLSAPDPWVNHASARQRHEPHTGSWLLKSDQYQKWREGQIRHLWLYGKAGCGKTVLSSTVIEDVRLQCEGAGNTALAVFYFSFSDNRQQSFESLLRSLVAQLGWKEPGWSMLQREYDKPDRSLLATEALEEILLSSIGKYDYVFLVLDALDECPEIDEARRTMLEGLERLSGKASNLKLLATSRELQDIRERMSFLGVDFVPISKRSVDVDIGKYVGNELSRHLKLSRLNEDLKTLIMETFAGKADGMFRWAYCQLQELKKLKSTRPSHVKEALYNLPETLHETYERMLTGIEKRSRKDALVLLRWLAYARSPPSLGELAEARIIDPAEDGSVNVDDRGGLEDSLDILAGLITVEGVCGGHDASKDLWLDDSDSQELDQNFPHSIRQVEKDIRVRLAHFSVKEYLESEGILRSNVKMFYLESAREHRFLAQSCLTYLLHYSSSEEKASDQRDLTAFPLLEYAAHSWFYHSRLQGSDEVEREINLLQSDVSRHNWCLVHQPDLSWYGPFARNRDVGTGLYYACFLGLGDVVGGLLSAGADVNVSGGEYGNALQAASISGHDNVAEILTERGADVNTSGGKCGNALQAASWRGHEKVVSMLIKRGADVNAQGGLFGNALQAASAGGHEKVVEMLLEQGADINAQDSFHGTALRAASDRGHGKVMSMLIEGGADVNAQKGRYGNVLQGASWGGHEKVVSTLIQGGAVVNAQGGFYGNALQVASDRGHEKVASMLIEGGANVNAQGGTFGNALQAASAGGHEEVVEMLIERGAHVNAQGGTYGNALQAASLAGHEKVVQMLQQRGAVATEPP